MTDFRRLVHDVVKRRKKWLPSVALCFAGFVGFVALFNIRMELWREIQEVDLNAIPAVFVFFAVWGLIFSFAWSYRKVILVAVVGMVIGAIAGVFPYLAIAIFLILLQLSPEGQATSRELSELFNNDIFSQLFYVAGAASGGPIAVYVYHREQERRR